jgi:tripartite-type tricarboxylate transporter receptor subunit TctC
MPLDTLKDLEPVATLVNTQMVLSVSPALPVRSLQEFVDHARRANPPLAYASIGNGSQHHLVMEMLKSRAGIDLLHVPFKGGGPATVAILAGEVSVMFGGNSVAGHIKSGKLRALAVAGKKRSAAYPDLPRLAEFYPDLEVTPWLAVFSPREAPAAVLARLRNEIGKLLAETDFRDKIRNVGGLEPYGSRRSCAPNMRSTARSSRPWAPGSTRFPPRSSASSGGSRAIAAARAKAPAAPTARCRASRRTAPPAGCR